MILIKSAEQEGHTSDILIEGNKIKRISSSSADMRADITIDGSGKAIIPGIINMHTHAAMTLLRGYADDMPLKTWLEDKIWLVEKKLTPEDCYWGVKLACLEMIKSGTTSFFDMYYHCDMTAKAVGEMGMKAFLSEACFDFFDSEKREKSKKAIRDGYHKFINSPNSGRLNYAIGPHAIYSVSGELLQWAHAFAKDNGIMIHLHLAETEDEVANAVKQFGTTPVRYLHRLGILSPHLVLAHVIHIDDEEIEILAGSGASVVHNPASNMKLASGGKFKFREMKAAGIKVALGTDGCASSNNLDMIETMKLAALLGKVWRKDPEALTCDEMLEAATKTAADILKSDAGAVREGMAADVCLIDLNIPAFTPGHHFTSNLVYAANGSCVDTVICDGQILMQNKTVEGEACILKAAAQTAENLCARPPHPRNQL